MKKIVLQLGQSLIIVGKAPVVPKEPVRELTLKERYDMEFQEMKDEIQGYRNGINAFIARLVEDTNPTHQKLVERLIDENLDLLNQLKRTEENVKKTYLELVKNP